MSIEPKALALSTRLIPTRLVLPLNHLRARGTPFVQRPVPQVAPVDEDMPDEG